MVEKEERKIAEQEMIEYDKSKRIESISTKIAGGLFIVPSIKKAEEYLGEKFEAFIRGYARHDIQGLMLACCYKESLKEHSGKRKTILIPEYKAYLEYGLATKLECLGEKGKIPLPDVIEAVELVENSLLTRKVKRLEKLCEDYDIEISHVTETLIKIYGEAWKSGPHQIHVHKKEKDENNNETRGSLADFAVLVKKSQDDYEDNKEIETENNGELITPTFYYPKEFKDQTRDDHKTMTFVIRALCGNWSTAYGTNSFEKLEQLVYEDLINISNYEHFKVKGVKLEQCDKEDCKE